MLIDTPFATHEVKRTEAQHNGFLKLCHEHAHEADAREVADATLSFLVLLDGDAELVPLHGGGVAVAQAYAAVADIHDVVASNGEVFRTYADMILEVTLVLVQRVVLVDVLHVRSCLVAGVVALVVRVVVRRVALWHVNALVALKDGGSLLVEVTATIVMVVVVGRVGHPSLTDAVVSHRHVAQEVGINSESPFLVIGQSVEANILQLTTATGSGKGIVLRGLHRNLTPLCLYELTGAIDRHAALVELITVTQDVLADLTQIDVEVTAILRGSTFLTGIDEGVEHPELDVLDVCLLKVVGVQLTHHTAPALRGIGQRTVSVQVSGQVIGSALRRIVRQVQDGQRRGGTVVGALVAVGIELADIDLTHIVVRQLFQVALDVSRRQR